MMEEALVIDPALDLSWRDQHISPRVESRADLSTNQQTTRSCIFWSLFFTVVFPPIGALVHPALVFSVLPCLPCSACPTVL